MVVQSFVAATLQTVFGRCDRGGQDQGSGHGQTSVLTSAGDASGDGTGEAKETEVGQVNEKMTGSNSVYTAAVPEALDDPLRNRGAAFTEAEREALGLS